MSFFLDTVPTIEWYHKVEFSNISTVKGIVKNLGICLQLQGADKIFELSEDFPLLLRVISSTLYVLGMSNWVRFILRDWLDDKGPFLSALVMFIRERSPPEITLMSVLWGGNSLDSVIMTNPRHPCTIQYVQQVVLCMLLV